MSSILDIKEKNSLQNATETLKAGGVLVFPTDTVYGIGTLLVKKAIKNLYAIKRRKNQPTAILMNKSLFLALYRSSANIGNLPKKFWQGKMTIIFDATDFDCAFPESIVLNNTIGIRLPKHKWLSELILEVGPIVTSSANRAGEQTPTSFNELNPEIIQEADLVIETDQKMSGKPSIIYDSINNIVLRK